jgi:uncharacterized BrkB/YihY/UPF0761 family membrane protein
LSGAFFSGILHRIANLVDLLETAARRFYRDGLTQRANAIAYSLLISIVPLLTIAMRFTNVNREELRFQLTSFFQLYGITGAEPVVNALDDILGRSNTIAGIGLLFMIYAAINIFSYLEETANHIFRVKPRPWLIRNSIFTSWLVVSPFFILITVNVLSDVQNAYSHPAIIDMRFENDRLYLLRDRHRLTIRNGKDDIEEQEILYVEKTDFNVPGRNITPDVEATEAQESSNQRWKEQLGPAQSIYVQGDRIYIVARPNFLFFSLDAGQSWDYRVFQSTYDRGASVPRIESVRVEPQRLLLLLSSPRGSRLLQIHPERMEVQHLTAFREIHRSIIFTGQEPSRYILTARGMLRESPAAFQWSEPRSVPALSETIIDLQPRPERGGWLALTGTGRVAILDKDLASTFPALHLPPSSGVSGVIRDATGRLFLWTKSGEIRASLDEGESWMGVDIFRPEASPLTVFRPEPGGFRIGTDQNALYRFRLDRIALKQPGEIPVLRTEPIESEIPSTWRPLIGHLLVNLLAFFALNIIFTFSYSLLPNADVSLTAAWLGALLTSTISLGFTAIFRQIIPLFANTGVVYGIWVALPLGLMVLLFLVQFFLLGLEITRLLDSPRLIRRGIIVSTIRHFAYRIEHLDRTDLSEHR